MKASEAVKAFFVDRERTNVLATSDGQGKVNLAVFGSPAFSGDDALVMMLGDNRSWENLQGNPEAALLVIRHGSAGMKIQGCRVYLKLRETADSGPEFDGMKAELKARIGDAAEILKHWLIFDITEARPILDFGQGI
ncbi:MAG: pyridoxamine 5'-phosphate oxidase family protein [Pseudomonadota bacterium]